MPTISGVSPQAFGDGRSVTVTGSGFGASGTVTIGGLTQTVTSWTDTAVVFTAVRGTQSMGPAVLDVVGGGDGTLIFGDNFDAGVLTGWTSYGSQNGGSITVITDTAQTYLGSAGSLKFSHPAGFNGVAAWANINILGFNKREIFIEFVAKMPSNKWGGKFCKVFGENVSGSYANTTFGLDYVTGDMLGVASGDGVNIGNDSVVYYKFAGSTPGEIGRNYNLPGFSMATPMGAKFAATDWGTSWHKFRFRVKFNSGTTSLNEVNDGEYDVWIDGNKYLEVRGCFNRHYSNGPIRSVQLFEWTQGTPPLGFEIWYDDFKVSENGFMP